MSGATDNIVLPETEDAPDDLLGGWDAAGRQTMAAFNASKVFTDGASFINGQEIVVDGGWTSTKYLSDFALNSEWVAP